MAETSAPWDGVLQGDATIAPYDAPTEWASYWRSVSGAGGIVTNLGGVFSLELNSLSVVNSASSPATIRSGRALAYGTWYENTANVTVAIATPAAATRIDRIVLRKDWTAQTVRLTRIAGVEGGAAPALTQTPGVTWDTPLWQASITTGGVITYTDERAWLPNSPLVLARSAKLDLVGTAAETNILNYTVPANTLGLNRTLRFKCSGVITYNRNTGDTISVRVRFGGSLDITIAHKPGDDTLSADPIPFSLEVLLTNTGTPVNHQDIIVTMLEGLHQTAVPYLQGVTVGSFVAYGFDSKDIASAQALVVALALSTAAAGNEVIVFPGTLELL